MASNSLPPVPSADAEHLKLIEIFHYVFGGLNLLVLPFLFLHYTFMSTIFGNPKLWQNQRQPPPFDPAEFIHIFVWFYIFMGVLVLGFTVLNVASGLCIRRRTARQYSLIVAGIDCLAMPLGTALGVFAIIVLTRPTVGALYGQARARENSSHK